MLAVGCTGCTDAGHAIFPPDQKVASCGESMDFLSSELPDESRYKSRQIRGRACAQSRSRSKVISRHPLLPRLVFVLASQGFPSGMPEALTIAGIDPLALAVLLWLGLVNTALVLFLETDALESVSASGEFLQKQAPLL